LSGSIQTAQIGKLIGLQTFVAIDHRRQTVIFGFFCPYGTASNTRTCSSTSFAAMSLSPFGDDNTNRHFATLAR